MTKLVVTGRLLAPNETFKKLNPQLFPATDDARSGRLVNPEREPNPLPALDKSPKVQHRRKRRLVICVEIVGLKHRRLDDDNIVAGSKALRDAIAASLGVDDHDKRIQWSYGSCQTSGREQTIVRISVK